MKKEWVWPAGIIASFAIFIAFMMTIWFFYNSQRIDLVTQNYYERQIQYQGQIDRITRTRNFFGTTPNRNSISLSIPTGAGRRHRDILSALKFLYGLCPSDRIEYGEKANYIHPEFSCRVMAYQNVLAIGRAGLLS
jgi:hypothetical protein